MSTENDRTVWFFDKRVIAVSLFIIAQTYYGTQLISEIQSEIRIARDGRNRLEARVERVEAARDDIAARLIRVEEKITGTIATLNGTNATLEEILRAIHRMNGDNGQRR